MTWIHFLHDEFSRVDSEISAFMTGFHRAVTVDLGVVGGAGNMQGWPRPVDWMTGSISETHSTGYPLDARVTFEVRYSL
jgi:hypothetical protein